MQTLTDGYHSLSLLTRLNWDRLLYAFTVAAALGFGAWVGSLL